MNNSTSIPFGSRRCGALAATLTVAALVQLAFPLPAPGQGDKSPPALAWVSSDARALLHLRVADLSANLLTSQLREPLDRPWRIFLEELPKALELPAAEVESATLVLSEVPSISDVLLPSGRNIGRDDGRRVPATTKDEKGEAKKSEIKEENKPKNPPPAPTPARQKDKDGHERDSQLMNIPGGRLLILTITDKKATDKLVLKAAGKGEARMESGKVFMVLVQDNLALYRAGDRVVLLGTEKEIRRALKAGPTKIDANEMAPALKLAHDKYQLVLGVFGPDGVAQGLQPLVGDAPLGRAFRPLVKAKALALGVRFDKETRFTGEFTFATEKVSADAVPAVEDLLTVLRLGALGMVATLLEEQLGDSLDPKEEQQFMSALLVVEQLQKGLRQAKVTQGGKNVTFNAVGQTDVEALTKVAAAELKARAGDPAFQAERLKKRSQNNLKQIGLALHNYHGVYKTFPPAASVAKGKPLLSWRVLILPFIEQDPLYRQFKLDEPWDSAHNIKLLSVMPKIYAPVGVKTKEPHSTFYQAIVGPGAGWEKDGQRKGMMHFLDGTSNTVIVGEAATAVPWTKPDDIPFDEKNLRPRFGGLFKDGFHALFADGHIQFIRQIDEATLRALITRAGGEVVDPEKIR